MLLFTMLSIGFAEEVPSFIGNPFTTAMPHSNYVSLKSGFVSGENQYQFMQATAGGTFYQLKRRKWNVATTIEQNYAFLQVPSEQRTGRELLATGIELRFHKEMPNVHLSLGGRWGNTLGNAEKYQKTYWLNPNDSTNHTGGFFELYSAVSSYEIQFRVDLGVNTIMDSHAIVTSNVTRTFSPKLALQLGVNVGYSFSQVAHASLVYLWIDNVEISLGGVRHFRADSVNPLTPDEMNSTLPMETILRMEYRK